MELQKEVAGNNAAIAGVVAEKFAAIAEKDKEIAALVAEKDVAVAKKNEEMAAVIAEKDEEIAAAPSILPSTGAAHDLNLP